MWIDTKGLGLAQKNNRKTKGGVRGGVVAGGYWLTFMDFFTSNHSTLPALNLKPLVELPSNGP